MPRPALPRRRLIVGAAVAAAAVHGLAARARAQGQATLSLYSARHYNTDEALYENFTKSTGIRIARIDAEGDPLLERMKAEGPNSPCDVFLSVDAGRIEAARRAGLLQPIRSATLEAAVPAHLRDPEGHWFGFSKRARVVVYARARATPADAPTYESLAEPKLRGRLVVRSSTNVYNQSLTGSLIAAHGEERTEAWARGLVANFARSPRGGDRDQILAVAAGEADFAVANTYYLVNMLRSARPDEAAIGDRVGVVFPNQNDRGTHINVSGGGVAAHAKNRAAAIAFLEYLVSPPAQAYFADGNSEYPVIAGVAVNARLAELGEFREDKLNARVYAENNAAALRLMDRAGWK